MDGPPSKSTSVQHCTDRLSPRRYSGKDHGNALLHPPRSRRPSPGVLADRRANSLRDRARFRSRAQRGAASRVDRRPAFRAGMRLVGSQAGKAHIGQALQRGKLGELRGSAFGSTHLKLRPGTSMGWFGEAGKSGGGASAGRFGGGGERRIQKLRPGASAGEPLGAKDQLPPRPSLSRQAHEQAP